MIKCLTFISSLLISCSLLADPSSCLYSLRSIQGLSPANLSDSFLIKIHKTLAGELDPVVLGDGGIVTGSWLGGVRPAAMESIPFLIIFEHRDNHPYTTKIDEAYFRGSQFLLLKTTCLAQIKNEKQMRALESLVTRHMKPPRGSQFKYFIFE